MGMAILTIFFHGLPWLKSFFLFIRHNLLLAVGNVAAQPVKLLLTYRYYICICLDKESFVCLQ